MPLIKEFISRNISVNTQVSKDLSILSKIDFFLSEFLKQNVVYYYILILSFSLSQSYSTCEFLSEVK